MGMTFGLATGDGGREPGIDRTKLRLAVFALVVIAIFVALFSRLWFLQVLASDDYRQLARENRVRLVHSEPVRGQILDRNGKILVKNRPSIAVTVDRQVVDTERKVRKVLGRLSDVLNVKYKFLKKSFYDTAVSPYKPVVVITDVSERDATFIAEMKNRFPGVATTELPIRELPQGNTAANLLGYVGEISEANLKDSHFKNARFPYLAGDLVGKSGLEYYYDRYLRGRPEIRKVVVDSGDDVVASRLVQEATPGNDLHLSLDIEIQRLAEQALDDGLNAARTSYQAPAGAAVVMDPETGDVLGSASSPTFDPSILTDGITDKEWASLGNDTDTPDDDALTDRAIQSGTPPGSTFKVVTAGAALATDVATTGTYLDCPGAIQLADVEFNNWTSADMGVMGFPESLEVSCDTFYYQLGWELETTFGVSLDSGDGTERFQKYMRTAGFGHETGIDLPNEFDGVVPDEEWCLDIQDAGLCQDGWLPGYTVNMAIGQGDLIVTPIQMAVTFAAIANGGDVMEPHIGAYFSKTGLDGEEDLAREIKPEVRKRLPLDDVELGVIQQGLQDVISGSQGTAAGAFAGFPLDEYPIAGKTGTAQIGAVTSGLNHAWFVSYGPTDFPEYVVAVYLEKAGHGGESAAPVARQIWEGLLGIDNDTSVQLGSDASG